MTVEHLDFDAFSAHQAEWDRLLLASVHPLPFMCHAWLDCWWRCFGAGQRFQAIVLRDGEEWIAAVPLAVRRASLGLTVAELVGSGPVPTRGMGLADKCCIPMRADRRDAIAELVQALSVGLPDVDLIDLKGIDSGAALADAIDGTRLRHKLARSVSPYLTLEGDWQSYLASRSRNFRKHLKKYWRLLEESGTLELQRLAPTDDVSHWLREIFEVNELSWKGARGTNLFRAPDIREFFARLVPAMVARDALDLWVLRIDGRVACYELCFDFGGRIFSYNGAYRAELEQGSPGTALTAHVIEQAYLRGRIEYDMCRGEESYKARWSERRREELQLLLPAPEFGPRLKTLAGPWFKAKLKQWPWIERQADRFSGALNRRRYRH